MDATQQEQKLVKVFVSTVPGLEFISASEVNETFNLKSKKEQRGRVSFTIPVQSLGKLAKLRSVHHYWLVVSEFSGVWREGESKEEILQGLEKCMKGLPWDYALSAYSFFKEETREESAKLTQAVADEEEKLAKNGPNLEANNDVTPRTDTAIKANPTGICTGKIDDNDDKSPPAKIIKLDDYYKIPSNIKFRVTCSRNGKKHNFTSMEAAKYIGSGVKEHFNWEVNLENFDVEVLAFIEETEIKIALKLSEESKHNRNITFFGPTTLRATTSYSMLKMAGIKKGDIICDPMCGTGSICLEGVKSFPNTFHIGGELHSEGCQNAGKNFKWLEEHHCPGQRVFSFPHTILQWDACNMPLRSGLVDAVVCDLPFGKRIGYKGRNFQLYPAALKEFGRVCRAHGKAVLLTQHKSAMNKALAASSKLWKKQSTFFVNMGGLNVGIYVLKKVAANDKKQEETSSS